jgi:hypothetical protein
VRIFTTFASFAVDKYVGIVEEIGAEKKKLLINKVPFQASRVRNEYDEKRKVKKKMDVKTFSKKGLH